MGQSKRKREAAAARLVTQVQEVDLAPLTNPWVKAAVRSLMIKRGLLK